jgi:hypothetical protein
MNLQANADGLMLRGFLGRSIEMVVEESENGHNSSPRQTVHNLSR